MAYGTDACVGAPFCNPCLFIYLAVLSKNIIQKSLLTAFWVLWCNNFCALVVDGGAVSGFSVGIAEPCGSSSDAVAVCAVCINFAVL